jgi:flagellar biosynthesis protein
MNMPDSSENLEKMANPPSDRPIAVALAYSGNGQPPTVIAKGYGVVADSIVRRARESGLYVHASSELVKLLMNVDLDKHIPPQLYVAAAEILTWFYRLETGAASRQTESN